MLYPLGIMICFSRNLGYVPTHPTRLNSTNPLTPCMPLQSLCMLELEHWLFWVSFFESTLLFALFFMEAKKTPPFGCPNKTPISVCLQGAPATNSSSQKHQSRPTHFSFGGEGVFEDCLVRYRCIWVFLKMDPPKWLLLARIKKATQRACSLEETTKRGWCLETHTKTRVFPEQKPTKQGVFPLKQNTKQGVFPLKPTTKWGVPFKQQNTKWVPLQQQNSKWGVPFQQQKTK